MGLDIGVWGFGDILVVGRLVRCVRFVRMWSVSSPTVWGNVVVSCALLSHLVLRCLRTKVVGGDGKGHEGVEIVAKAEKA